ncbi:proteinase B [Mycoemilia scoparia]|uniref:Proteinase B n=1 Tax=Mycoemilia scoparia TaxID=417184 RepID=A0A9W8DQE1_9FUNG|nr:proteinase B [Mycoemilia scoparia]
MLFNRSILALTVLALGSTTASMLGHPRVYEADLFSSVNSEIIDDHYIVVFKDHVSPDAQHFRNHFSWLTNFITLANNQGGSEELNSIKHIYEHSLIGYAGRFQKEVLDHIRKSPDVAYVEKDSIVYANEVEKGAPWGLARISHREPLSFGNFGTYVYNPDGGEGVTAYVVDTGINTKHVDFESRASWGKTFAQDEIGDEDGNGHGTHVAGTIAGKRYGVAKKAKVVAVKVLGANGSGSTSGVISGIDFTVRAHKDEAAQAKRDGKNFKGSVANMSLGGGRSRSLDLTVDAAVKGGVFYAVAAGNENHDACQSSPAASELALTVGASTIADERAWFSNYGKCTDVFAPGKDILSAWIGSKFATNVISGTSMATPHVAGLAAYFLSLNNSTLTPLELKKLILEKSIKNALEDLPADTPNLLIYNHPKDF